VENPNGAETFKTVLLQAAEARRWTLTYGFGFESQTGTPSTTAVALSPPAPRATQRQDGSEPSCARRHHAQQSLRRELSVSVQATYGLLEQKVNLLFQNPHFEGNRNFGLTFSGGYANSLDVTTYVASKLEAGMRLSEHFNTPGSFLSKANTFVYEFDFRRVKWKPAVCRSRPGRSSN